MILVIDIKRLHQSIGINWYHQQVIDYLTDFRLGEYLSLELVLGKHFCGPHMAGNCINLVYGNQVATCGNIRSAAQLCRSVYLGLSGRPGRWLACVHDPHSCRSPWDGGTLQNVRTKLSKRLKYSLVSKVVRIVDIT